MNAFELVDAAACGRVLIAGTLPPEGRDLDVLAPPESYEAIREALRRNGFIARRTTWARFAPFELVDLRPLADESALARAVPLDGRVHLYRPGPGDDHLKPDQSRVRGRLRRVQESGVVALSGVDGSGKTTQAELLRDALVAAGFDAVVEWNRLSHDRWLDAVAQPVKKILGRRAPAPPRPASEAPREGAPPAGALRGAWVVVIALANAFAHLLSVRKHTLAGRLVVCDRYVLDSLVELRTRYPRGPGRRAGVALVKWLSPRPRAAFLLELPAEAAFERKPRPGRSGTVAAQVAAYAEESDRLGVVRIDATQPADAVVAEIARETWRRV